MNVSYLDNTQFIQIIENLLPYMIKMRRSYSPFAFMLFCNLTPLDGRFVNVIVFCRKSKFCEYITCLHIQHSIYVPQFEFFVFTVKQIGSILLLASIYIIHRRM